MNRYRFFSMLLIFTLNVCIYSQEITFSEWELVVDNQNFPEGITFDQQNTLYSSNCYGGWITKITSSSIDTFLLASDSTFSKTNGMIALKNGSIIACDYGKGTILNISSNGKCEIIIDGYNGVKLNRPNDLTLDTNGNLYFTDPKSYGKDLLDGRIFYYNFSSNRSSANKR